MTTTNEKLIPVEVPARYIKDKAVDYNGEIFAALGGCLPCGDLLVKAPSLGVYSLLETYESKFVANPQECSVMEFWRVLYINEHRQSCVQDVMEWARGSKDVFKAEDESTWASFDYAVASWGRKVCLPTSADDCVEDFMECYKWFSLSFEGFAMIPSAKTENSEYLFGADSIASMAASIGRGVDYVLWDIPLCMCGHLVAALCKQNGNEHVKRPKDDEDRRTQFAEARERIRKGELHPWQIADPDNWPLSAIQVQHNEKSRDAWKALMEERKVG